MPGNISLRDLAKMAVKILNIYEDINAMFRQSTKWQHHHGLNFETIAVAPYNTGIMTKRRKGYFATPSTHLPYIIECILLNKDNPNVREQVVDLLKVHPDCLHS